MYIQFVREMPETVDEKETWNWLRKADMKVETETMLMCRARRGNSNKLCETQDRQNSRMCDKKSETISHCEQNLYKRRHDNVAKIIHQKLCEKFNLKRSEEWYEHAPDSVVENGEIRISWDVMI